MHQKAISGILHPIQNNPLKSVTRRGLRGYKGEMEKPSNQAKSIERNPAELYVSVDIGAVTTHGR